MTTTYVLTSLNDNADYGLTVHGVYESHTAGKNALKLEVLAQVERCFDNFNDMMYALDNISIQDFETCFETLDTDSFLFEWDSDFSESRIDFTLHEVNYFQN